MRYLITGILTEEHINQALALGAHAVGIDFTVTVDESSIEGLREIIKKLPPFVAKVGIFKDLPRYQVEELITFLDLDTLIFCGQEDNEYLKRWYGQKIIKKITLETTNNAVLDDLVDAYLVDYSNLKHSTDKITKPLIISTNNTEEFLFAQKFAPWAVQVLRGTPLYNDFLNGRVQT